VVSGVQPAKMVLIVRSTVVPSTKPIADTSSYHSLRFLDLLVLRFFFLLLQELLMVSEAVI
jgi:hypothetical protein